MNEARLTFRISTIPALGVLGAFLAGCPQTAGPVGGNVVDITLAEFSVTTESPSTAEGLVTFRVANSGVMAHEFVVVRTDLAPDALPTEDNGAYVEDGEGTQVVGEISRINPGRTATLPLTLEAGSYVLLCNMVNQGFAHYSLGMRAGFNVTESDAGEP